MTADIAKKLGAPTARSGSGAAAAVTTLEDCHLRTMLGPPDWDGGCFSGVASDFEVSVEAVTQEVVCARVRVDFGSDVKVDVPPGGVWTAGGGGSATAVNVVVAARSQRVDVRATTQVIGIGNEPKIAIGQKYEVRGGVHQDIIVEEFDAKERRFRLFLQSGFQEPGTVAHWKLDAPSDLRRVVCTAGSNNWLGQAEQCVSVIDGGGSGLALDLLMAGTSEGARDYRLRIRRTTRKVVPTSPAGCAASAWGMSLCPD